MSENKTVVYYHAHCPDGFGAALAAWLHFGDAATYVPATHGETVPGDMAGKDVYILDYCFKPEVMSVLAAQARSLTVLDHHKSAQESMARFSCGCNCRLKFDMAKSGAVLAWEAFHPGMPVPLLFRHIMDRDLWQWQLEHSEDYLMALDALPFDFPAWKAVMDFTTDQYAEFVVRGQHMKAKFEDLSAKIAAKAAPISIFGVPGLAVNAPSEFASYVGQRLYQQSQTYAAIWRVNFHEGVPFVQVSLRGAPGFDCLAIAKQLGGGGHAAACAFRLPLSSLAEFLAGAIATTR